MKITGVRYFEKFLFQPDEQFGHNCDWKLAKLIACVHYFSLIFYFSSNDSPSNTMKNVFYFI